MRRRLTALLAVAALTLTGADAVAEVSPAGGQATGRFDLPRHGFAPPHTVLRDATPERARLDPAPLRDAERLLADWTRSDAVDGHPLFSGAVGLLVHDGMVVDEYAVGSAVRYADGSGAELPESERVPMRPDTIFDLASISKLFTSIAVMQLAERGRLDVTAPVARYLPEFGVHGKESITVRQLLTHTSGLEPFLPLWRDWPDEESRIRAVMEVAPQSEPGSTYTYSDLNLITLGVLVERLAGAPLDQVVAERITGPLGMTDTGYNPPAAKLSRIAATEYQSTPPRGMVRGEVHDENAWSLGGVAGHAGVFSTARDLAVLGQALLNGGSYAGERILRPHTVREMFTNHNTGFPGDAHGLGFELDQLWYMGGLTSPGTAGHTGYTGTSFVLDPRSRSIAILLTNRVHPTRSWGSVNPARRAWATGLARALAVRPAHGDTAWYSGLGDSASATLTTRLLRARHGGVHVRFDAFVDTETSDPVVLEASTDGAEWTPVPLTVRGRGAPRGTVDALHGTGHRSWWEVRGSLPQAENVTLRWRFTTDRYYTGRGVNIDGIRVFDAKGTLLDAERHPDGLDATGFQLRHR
ncbi:CubicO group peptidase (beta-lactamase class C family) [Prauserella shujinwangii]|uniref:CubicO group peptidase (Beta-lactamase class C family) n=1 Tax=Prauserella shujinwangii TaxID=1453103 RepID=A0A2T0M1T5_9PSEU|nr:serine hydrolase domain-containing protein [Prauserella shujinwangii]PRX50559.1 CubicO group peptidase (beta-lactamase class C family) [Prauserella shujinwangii]